jgi:hypothetical protein
MIIRSSLNTLSHEGHIKNIKSCYSLLKHFFILSVNIFLQVKKVALTQARLQYNTQNNSTQNNGTQNNGAQNYGTQNKGIQHN